MNAPPVAVRDLRLKQWALFDEYEGSVMAIQDRAMNTKGYKIAL
jgi:hypothetical protein